MASTAAGRRVLLVEDDRDTREVMARLIRRLGRDVRSAESVAEGIALVDGWAPTEVLLDLMLPDRAGSELLRHVRAAGLSARVALVTAAGPQSAALAVALALRPDAVFHKPVQFGEIEGWLSSSDGHGVTACRVDRLSAGWPPWPARPSPGA